MCLLNLKFHTESGIIVFHVISGNLAKKARVEVLLDDGYWPCFSTLKSRSSHAQFDYVGEGFLKEVEFGRVWLRLCEGEEGEKDDVIAEWKGDAKAFLQATMVCSFILLLHLNRYLMTIGCVEWASDVYSSR
jgi:Ca2+-dependent lipid-binding protein